MSTQLLHSEPDLGDELLKFVRDIDRLETPHDVLDALHDIAWRHCQLKMMGALRFPMRAGDIESLVTGETVFLLESMPKGFWEEWLELGHRQPGLGYLLAQQSLAPFTMTDLQRMVEPLAAEQCSFDLAHKYGILDGLTCPVGGRWLVAYWSKKVLADDFTPELRAMLYTGASFAVIRLQKLIGLQSNRIGQPIAMTPRELSVLRLLSMGYPTDEVASLLGLGEETVRSHIKKAQSKLGVKNRLHAVAQAMRSGLIPQANPPAVVACLVVHPARYAALAEPFSPDGHVRSAISRPPLANLPA